MSLSVTPESHICVETGLNIPCRARKLTGRLANSELYEKGGLCIKEKEKAYRCVSRAFWLDTTENTLSWKLSENLLGKLVFELEHAVAFEDEDRFGPLKILDYLHDKVFKMLGLYTLVERLCMHDGWLLNWDDSYRSRSRGSWRYGGRAG
jgi:hypothetical protein